MISWRIFRQTQMLNLEKLRLKEGIEPRPFGGIMYEAREYHQYQWDSCQQNRCRGTHKWQFVVGKPPIWRSEFMILSRSQYLDPCLDIFKGERTIRHQLLPWGFIVLPGGQSPPVLCWLKPHGFLYVYVGQKLLTKAAFQPTFGLLQVWYRVHHLHVPWISMICLLLERTNMQSHHSNHSSHFSTMFVYGNGLIKYDQLFS